MNQTVTKSEVTKPVPVADFPAAPLLQASRKLAGIHGLRGCAAFSIVVFHLWFIASLSLPEPILYFVKHLYLGVHLFFVISAFSLFHSQVHERPRLWQYLTKRLFRIAPLFYVVLLWNIDRAGWPGLKAILVNLTFTFNLFPGFESSLVWAGWSVGVEMIFYVLLPLIFLFVHRIRGFVVVLVACLIVQATWWHWGRLPFGDQYVYVSLLSNLVAFASGLLAYKVFLTRSAQIDSARGELFWLGVALLLFLLFDPISLHERITGIYFGGWGISFAIVCFVQALRPSTALRSSIFQWMGDRSFSIYLLHPIVIQLSLPIYAKLKTIASLGLLGTYALCLAATLLVLLPLAEVTYRFVERPGIALGRRLSGSTSRGTIRSSGDDLGRGEGTSDERVSAQ